MLVSIVENLQESGKENHQEWLVIMAQKYKLFQYKYLPVYCS